MFIQIEKRDLTFIFKKNCQHIFLILQAWLDSKAAARFPYFERSYI